ncbi:MULTISPECIES: hypothetical protein [unclassified Aeromicrobium]|uniref:hypothetical protein n=1 Tax=unclassified Aeromicrobium TaxID=2633570 RepID=UPI00396B03BC
MKAHVSAIRAASGGRYAVDVIGPAGITTYDFEVVSHPIPVAIWSDAFEDEIGTLTRPGQQIAAAVLDFHKLVQVDVPVRDSPTK